MGRFVFRTTGCTGLVVEAPNRGDAMSGLIDRTYCVSRQCPRYGVCDRAKAPEGEMNSYADFWQDGKCEAGEDDER